MVAHPPHNRKLGLCGVSLTLARLNKENDKAYNWVQDTIERIMVDSGFLDENQFTWVTIAIRFGLKYDVKPTYQKINKKYGDLPLSIEVDTHDLIDASLDELKKIFGKAVLISLIHAGMKYKRPTKQLEDMLESLS